MEKNREFGFLIDDRADVAQRDALHRIFTGEAGGAFAAWRDLTISLDGVEFVPMQVSHDAESWRVRVPGMVDGLGGPFRKFMVPENDTCRIYNAPRPEVVPGVTRCRKLARAGPRDGGRPRRPVLLHYIALEMDDEDNREITPEPDSPVVPIADQPGEHPFAVAKGGIGAEIARAPDRAIAKVPPVAGDAPVRNVMGYGHRGRGCSSHGRRLSCCRTVRHAHLRRQAQDNLLDHGRAML